VFWLIQDSLPVTGTVIPITVLSVKQFLTQNLLISWRKQPYLLLMLS